MSGIGVRISRKRTVALRSRESSFAKYGQRGTVIFSCLVDVVSDSFRYFPALVKLCDFYRDALLQFFIATSFSSSRAAWLKLSRLRQRFLTEGQGCRSAGGSVESRDLTDSKWRILRSIASRSGGTWSGYPGQWRTVTGIPWVLRNGAPWRDMPERYGTMASLGRAADTIPGHKLHDRAGAPASSRRKTGGAPSASGFLMLA